MSNDSIEDELARLRREIDDLKATVQPSSNQTTKSQRKALRAHIEDLDREIAKKKSPTANVIKNVVNAFKVGQIVELIEYSPTYSKGQVCYMACRLALPSKKECSKKECKHDNKNYVWVIWPNKKMFVYHFSKLRMMLPDELKPKIGRELSGELGPGSTMRKENFGRKMG